MNQWVKMIKGEEEKLVHPGNVDNHIRAGWELVETHAELEVQPEAEETVAVETHAESDVDEPIEADS